MTQVIRRNAVVGLRILAMALAGFLLVSLHWSTAHAQWATNGNNINNTNTGNVGIGTAAPANPFHVFRDWNSSSSTNVLAAFEVADQSGCSRIASRNAAATSPLGAPLYDAKVFPPSIERYMEVCIT